MFFLPHKSLIFALFLFFVAIPVIVVSANSTISFPNQIDQGVYPLITSTPTFASTPEPQRNTPNYSINSLSADILDDFNRINGPLGSNWSGDTANYMIASNQLDVGTSQDIYWSGEIFGIDQEAFITLSNIDLTATEIGLILKAQNYNSIGPGLIDVVYSPIENDVQVWSYLESSGTWVQHGSNLTASFENGDQLGAIAKANGDVEIYKNGVLLGVRDLTSWPYYSYGGYIGLMNVDAEGAILDDFGGGTLLNSPTLTPTPQDCTDPLICDPVSAVPAFWRCDIPECSGGDWVGTVIGWPSWSAYSNNARSGNNSRTVYSAEGEILYPYMGSWADGCVVTAVSGIVLIIEWERGADIWRETYLSPGQSHTIDLIAPEDGAMLESPNDTTIFSVSLSNCTPQSIIPDQYSLTTDLVGQGTILKNPDQSTYSYGQTITLTASSEPGWSFLGWSGVLSGTTNPETFIITNNSVVTATFDLITPVCYPLILNHSGEGSDPVADPTNSMGCETGQYTAGQNISLSGTAPNTGWHISSWTGTSNDSSTADTNSLVMPASSHPVSVNYERDIVTLNLDTSGSGSISTDPSGPYLYGDLVELTAIPITGWQFDHWEGDLSSSDNPASITLDGNKSVTAVFVQDSIMLTLETSGSGSISPSPTSPYLYGDQVELTAVPANGWQFDHWEGDLSGSDNPASIFMDSSKSVTAVFVQDTVILTLDTSGSGSISPSPTSPYIYGDLVQLTAVPANGWQFDHWEGDLSGSDNPASIFMETDKSVTAVFVQDTIMLTLDTSGSGSISPSPAGPYIYGDQVELTAVPATGWQFDHWEGDLSGSNNPESINLDSDKSVTAVFEALSTCYTLILSHNGQGSDPTASPSHSANCPIGQFIEGETISLSGAIPSMGWKISGWEGTLQDDSPSDMNLLVMPTNDHTVRVVYKLFLNLPIVLNSNLIDSTRITQQQEPYPWPTISPLLNSRKR